ncbi:MAG: peptidylprolyl isomerase [Rickettsiales bacterium]|nr:peptidylprolyl isomerase [Rickettsiales bacterium]
MKKIFLSISIFCLICFLQNNVYAQNAVQTEAPVATPTATTTNNLNENTEMKKTTKKKMKEAIEDSVATENTEAQPNSEANEKLENIIVLELKDGPVIIELKPEIAPNHVERFKQLTRQGFYDNIVFHRVIDGFMAQTGDPTGTGRGGSGQNINSEFSDEKHVRGTLSMARAADPNSADSQFFIMFSDAPHLDGNYSAFGQVIAGMDNVDKIKRGTGANGMVSNPDKIIKMRVAADIPQAELPASLRGEDADAVDANNVTSGATDATPAAPATQAEQSAPADAKAK